MAKSSLLHFLGSLNDFLVDFLAAARKHVGMCADCAADGVLHSQRALLIYKPLICVTRMLNTLVPETVRQAGSAMPRGSRGSI